MQMTNDRFYGCWMVAECERRALPQPKRIISEELNIIRQANTSSKNVWCAAIFSICVFHFRAHNTHTHTPSSISRFMIICFLCELRFAYITAPRNWRAVVRNAALCQRRTVGVLSRRTNVTNNKYFARMKKKKKQITGNSIEMIGRDGVARQMIQLVWFGTANANWPRTDEVMWLRRMLNGATAIQYACASIQFTLVYLRGAQ